MADKRKLQAEIDRCLKKVTEGVETFDDIWEKVHTAANANQKEKYEADLKKEIKKLQRLRDQIKTWIASSEIKDKSPLVEHRKLIETQMEKFKIVERETKTKAYSKEGLGSAAKIDPIQRERDDIRQWLTDCIDRLSQEVEQFDAEIESLYAGSKKRKLDRDKADRVEELTEWVDRHKYHIRHLEAILRKLDNCTMEPDEIRDIQEDVNYYIDCSQEPDFTENELIYDDLCIDDGPPAAQGIALLTQNDDEVFSGPPHSPPTSSTGPLSPTTNSNNKAITPLKSTSQELFDERRRGKSLSQSESTAPEVPPSPRRAPTKSHSVSSNSTMPITMATTMPMSLPLMTTIASSITTTPISNSSRTVSISRTSSTPSSISSSSKAPSLSLSSIPTSSTTSLTMINNNRVSSQPSTNGSTGKPTIVQLPKAALPPAGPAYSVAAGGHHNNTPAPASLSPPSQQSLSNSMVNHTGGILSPSETTSMPTVPSGMPLQNGPVSLLSPLSKQQHQISGLLPMTSPLSNQKPPSDQQLPNSTVSSSQSSTNSSFLDETVFTAPSSGTITAPQPAHLTVDTQFHQEQQQPLSTPSSVASGNSTPNSSAGGVNSNSSPVSRSTPPLSSHGLTNSSLVNDSTALLHQQQGPNMSLRPASTSNAAAMLGQQHHSLNMIMNANAFHPPNAFTSAAILQSSTGLSKFSSTDQFGGFSSSSNDGIISGSVLSPSSSVSSIISAGLQLSSTMTTDTTTTPQLSSLKAIAEQAVVQANLFPPSRKLPEGGDALRSLVGMDSLLPERSNSTLSRSDAHLQPLLGVSPLGPVMLNKENISQSRMLDTVFRHLPQPADSEKVRPYLQRNPHPSPLYHHQHPPATFDNFDLYQRLSIETLFFIFYYMEGTKAQYLAAKALKKQSWRFHTKYMMWFQRHEEPKAITDEYEMGTYIYFDFEKWQQRKKDGFTFEYKFLEDKELP
ncbi:CCR4-NOT transcription complex subunit 3-like [Dysidea avara]|uniref:CCR4-NOT transcription complex subunit 3-like n=1 Tax=Dysidea avara TaxID=196820 RepID=UPI0033266015